MRKLGMTIRQWYTDPEIFQMEKKQIFDRTWQFVAHASEVPDIGSFVLAAISDEPVIVVRGEDKKIRVFFNSCRHRGAFVTRELCGKQNSFRCPYHSFEYNLRGDLIEVPNPECYEEWFKKENFGLVEVPRVEEFAGLVLASLDPSIKPFSEYLDKARENFDYVCTDNGKALEVIGKYSYTVQANWKLLVENTVDGYHTPHVHGKMLRNNRNPGGTPPIANTKDLGKHGLFERYDTLSGSEVKGGRDRSNYLAIFPNILCIYAAAPDVNALRIVKPLSVDSMEVLTYCLCKEGESEELRESKMKEFSGMWGPGGRFGTDDIETLELAQMGLKARHGAEILLSAARHSDDQVEGNRGFEYSARAFWRGWEEYMGLSIHD